MSDKPVSEMTAADHAAQEPPADQAWELLAVVLEALDIPSPYTVGDGEVHDKILSERVLHAKITLQGVVGGRQRHSPDAVAWSIGYLRRQLAEHPAVGYKTWQQGVAERHAAVAAEREAEPELEAADDLPDSALPAAADYARDLAAELEQREAGQ
jgi:hypothetical protein